MGKLLVSPKWSLIWDDIKSWAISGALILGPIILGQLLELLRKQDYGSYTEVVLMVIGLLLKLVQKLKARSTYEVKNF